MHPNLQPDNDEIDPKLIETMINSINPNDISRDDVRRWVVREQYRLSRRNGLTGLVVAASFVLLASGILWLMSNQAKQIQQLVKKQPRSSLVKLEMITAEVCNAVPADYFVHQLRRQKKSSRLTTM